MRVSKTILLALVAVMLVAVTSGCTNTMRAIEHSDLSVQAKMSDTVFLEPEVLTANPKIFVRVANTSDFQDIDFSQGIRDKLRTLGYELTTDAAAAQYQVTANVLYMGEAKAGMNMDSVIQSGFGGAIVGASVAGVSGARLRGAGGTGVAVGLVAAGADALAGMAFKVTDYIGVVDLQIREAVPGGVTGTEQATLTNGSAAVTRTTRNLRSDRQEYRTRIAVNACQTNIDRAKAVQVISERLCDQVTGLFRM